MKIDIKKYFYNIDHNVLKELLKDKLNYDEYIIISKIRDSINNNYINENINKLKNNLIKLGYNKDKVNDLPLYKNGKGLSLGAMSS